MALTAAQIAQLKSNADSPAQYGDGTDSTVGTQFNTSKWIKESLIELAPVQWFTQVASTYNMPKHMGKKLKRYLYLPLLDDRNINDQGIDAAGVKIVNGNLYGSSRDINTITKFQPHLTEYGGKVNRISFTRIDLEGTFEEFGFHYIYTQDQLQFDTDTELRRHNVREAMRGAVKIYEDRLQVDLVNMATTIVYGGDATMRAEVSGNEDVGAGKIPSLVTYDAIVQACFKLDDLDAPQHTTVVKGSTKVDTVTINDARLMYVGTKPMTQLMKLKDYHGKQAYFERRQYADAGSVAHGEHGAIAGVRVIKVGKDMTYFGGQGAEVVPAENIGRYSYSNVGGVDKYDVHPMIILSSEAYTTISFKNASGGSNKFEYYDQPPKQKTGRGLDDPFGKVGFSALSWYYGFMALRPERCLRFEVCA